MMNEANILRDLGMHIETLDRSVNDLRMQVSKESAEINEIQNQVVQLKSKYDMKKATVVQMNQKLDEKTKILNEARRAYGKIVENTTRLIQAVSSEASNDKFI
jgi:predicted  nucleic acid-binding Zn-ribbon protein